jgi:serine phosphatase RsbU (regulator of sigma subunit)
VLVLLGALFGLLPFLVLAVAFPSFLHTEEFVFYGVGPLALVPLTFAYAIVRFQLLDIRVIVRKSLLYTATSLLVTAFYALGIAFFTQTRIADSGYFPIVLAVAIVVLFEPLRRRIQGPIDRFFFAERTRLQRAMLEMGEAFGAQLDLGGVVRDLVQKLPALLNLRFAALYLRHSETLDRVAGPDLLPRQLPHVPELHEHLRRHGGLALLDDLPRIVSIRRAEEPLRLAGVEVVGELASRRRSVGIVALSGKVGQMAFESEELRLLGGLLHQAGVALDTSLLVEERTREAELERELEIAASIQRSLLPQSLTPAAGWRIAAVCRPARHVGGDFFVELPGATEDGKALVYGDVSGKSVPGALMMMAAHEVLYSLAMAHRDPEVLLDLANQRLYKLGKRSFVALGYFACAPGSDTLQYTLAGQPQPLKRSPNGDVVELPLPPHRLPLGALLNGAGYTLLDTSLANGELVLGYSDGVVDAVSPEGEPFGSDRLVDVLRAAPGDPHDVIEHVLEALALYTGGLDPYDDVTLVAVSRQPEVRHA